MVDLQRDELGLDEFVGHAVSSMLKRVRTAMPAQIIAFNEAQNTVDVQPVLQRKVKGVVGNQPPVMNVPVIMYGSGGFVVTHKPQAGDVCLLVVTDRSMDAWKAKGGIADPADQRSHDPTDSVAILGINPFGAAYADIKDGIDIRSRDGTVSLNVDTDLIKGEVDGGGTFEVTADKISHVIGSLEITMEGSAITLKAGGQTLELSTTGLQHNGVNIGATHTHYDPSNTTPITGTPVT